MASSHNTNKQFNLLVKWNRNSEWEVAKTGTRNSIYKWLEEECIHAYDSKFEELSDAKD
ncbi:MAG: hypothetical protein K0U78_15430 [Actinomycetia bacterium]|nr:hypothetical protein [Actinomycetes bacterium]